MKKYFIKTYGCQMNEHDTEVISGILEKNGFLETEKKSDADIIILNTCTIREKAAHKVFSDLGKMKHLKSYNPGLLIGVGGCVGKQDGNSIIKRMPWVDIVFSPSDVRKPEKLAKMFSLELSDPTRFTPKRVGGIKAWVSIMYGCNNFCSYCVVPFTRGGEVSRSLQEIVDEVEELGRNGCKEIILLGQNVNSYADGDTLFPDLLERINRVESIERIRFVTSHPKDFSPELSHSMKELSKVCESVHLPLQSGSTSVLARMNRKYDFSTYMQKVDLLRNLIPQCSITSDIIVGFPGETEEDFNETMSALKKIEFDNIFAFAYSERPNTTAIDMPDHVAEDVKKKRLNKLITLQKSISFLRNERYLGKTIKVLVEGKSKKDPEKLMGRDRSNLIVNFKGNPDLIGQFVNVEIVDASSSCLYGATATQ